MIMDDFDQILESGIVFSGAPKGGQPGGGKVKTKAKKKQYITGAHGRLRPPEGQIP